MDVAERRKEALLVLDDMLTMAGMVLEEGELRSLTAPYQQLVKKEDDAIVDMRKAVTRIQTSPSYWGNVRVHTILDGFNKALDLLSLPPSSGTLRRTLGATGLVTLALNYGCATGHSWMAEERTFQAPQEYHQQHFQDNSLQ